MRRATGVALTAALLALAGLASESGGSATATICTGVKDRAPVGAAATFPGSVGRLYCFSELTGVAGKAVHVWYRADREVFRIELPVRASRWRTWSAKSIPPSATGAWRVEVRDADGNVLATVRFTIE